MCPASAHLRQLHQGLAQLLDLILAVQDSPEVLGSPVLKEEARH